MPTSQIVERPAKLLAYLFASRAEVKRAKLRQWLKHGSIRVNGKSITRFDHALQIGDVVSVRTKKKVLAKALLPPALKVLFEDLTLAEVDPPRVVPTLHAIILPLVFTIKALRQPETETATF